MTEHLFKLKKDGKYKGLMKIQDGEVYVQRPKSKYWDFQYVSCRVSPEANIIIKFDTAHPFVTKDKNGKDVFADDEITGEYPCLIETHKVSGIIYYDTEELMWFLETESESIVLSYIEDIELIEEKDNE